jgi:hypothetical protein
MSLREAWLEHFGTVYDEDHNVLRGHGEDFLGNSISLVALAAAFALVVPATNYLPTHDGIAAAKASKFSKRKSRRRSHAPAGLLQRGTTEGSCPCNGGDVCVGPRGGRYCITGGGNKRYGV